MTTIVYGTSIPGMPEVSTAMIRTYNVSDLNQVQALGYPVFHSTKPSATQMDDLAGLNGVPAQNAEVTRVTNEWLLIHDLAGIQQYVTYWHEANPTVLASTWKAGAAKIVSSVMPVVNAGRARPLWFGPVFASNVGSTSGGQAIFGNGYSRALVDTWVPAGVDYIGLDIYITLSNLTNGHDYAVVYKGLPWNIPEQGTSVAYDPADDNAHQTGGKTSHLQHMQDVVALNNSFGAGAASPILWFNQNHNLLNTTLVGATLAGATSIVVDLIPGKQDVGTWEMLSGYQIIVDPHGAHPETVSLTSGTSAVQGAGNPPPATFTLHVPALGFAHANGAVVWLMPQSIQYWRTPPPSPAGGGSFFNQLSVGVTATPLQKMLTKHTLHAGPTNLLSPASSSFEDGSIGAWTSQGVSFPTLANTTTQVKSGLRAMQATWQTVSGSSFGVAGQAVAFTCVPGREVLVTFWVYVPAGVSGLRGNINGTAAFTQVSTLTNQWQQLTLAFVPTSTSHTVTVYPVNSTTAGQVTYLDLAFFSASLARDPFAAVVARLVVVEAALVLRQVAVTHIRTAVVTLLRAIQNQSGRLLTVSVVQAPSAKVKQVVSAVVPRAVVAPLARFQMAATATSRVVESVARLVLNSTAGLQTVHVTQTPVARVKQAVGSTLRTPEAALLRVSAAVSVTVGPAVEAALLRVSKEVVTSSHRASEAAVANALTAALTIVNTVRTVQVPIPRLALSAVRQTRTAATTTVGRLLTAVGAVVTAVEAPARAARNPAVTNRPTLVVAPLRRVQNAVTVTTVLRATTTVAARVGQAVAARLLAAPTLLFGYVTNLFGTGNIPLGEYTIRVGTPTYTIEIDDTPLWGIRA